MFLFRDSVEDLIQLFGQDRSINRRIVDDLSYKYPNTNITNIIQVVSLVWTRGKERGSRTNV